MFQVYILQSEVDGSYYTGITTDIEKRFAEHNRGNAKYSSGKYPYHLVWHCAFADKQKAYDFEKYLKSGSGIAFRNKHLL